MEVITSLADSAPKSGKIPQQMSGVTRGFRDQQGRARFCLGRASQSTSISLLSEYQAGGGKCATPGRRPKMILYRTLARRARTAPLDKSSDAIEIALAKATIRSPSTHETCRGRHPHLPSGAQLRKSSRQPRAVGGSPERVV